MGIGIMMGGFTTNSTKYGRLLSRLKGSGIAEELLQSIDGCLLDKHNKSELRALLRPLGFAEELIDEIWDSWHTSPNRF
jgi:hypothetical protein